MNEGMHCEIESAPAMVDVCPVLDRVATSRLSTHTLSGRPFDECMLIELHCKRVSEDVLFGASVLGYSDKPIIGVASEIVKAWRFLGVLDWTSTTFEYLVRVLLVLNRGLHSNDKDHGFYLLACAACMFCIDRAVAHSRRGRVQSAEMWLSGAQELRFAKLGTSFSIQASMARAGAQAKDVTTGQAAKRAKIREIWASGKYASRDICAEQECASLDMSFSTARKSLRGTPDPA